MYYHLISMSMNISTLAKMLPNPMSCIELKTFVNFIHTSTLSFFMFTFHTLSSQNLLTLLFFQHKCHISHNESSCLHNNSMYQKKVHLNPYQLTLFLF